MQLLKYRPNKESEWKEIATIAIGNVPSGGSLPAKALIISGDCKYKFYGNNWNWYIEQFGDKITTKDITNANSMFDSSYNITEIPFDLNFSSSNSNDLSRMFYNCYNLTQSPKLNNVKVYDTINMFGFCNNLRTIPEDIADTWDWSYIESQTSQSSGNQSNMFYYCCSLRSIPMNLIKSGNPYASYQYSYYYYGFNGCYALDELINLPIPYTKAIWTSSTFYKTFNSCSRLKNITFKTNDDGTGITVKWKNQVIDLTDYVGYVEQQDTIIIGNSGITADKEVTNATTYASLKNDPDWFTCNINYSRYNHDSAVRTINSLPDASAYLASYSGTNTIKFKGASGSSTDGGAINTLTSEEIAVATAKGWTVTFV